MSVLGRCCDSWLIPGHLYLLPNTSVALCFPFQTADTHLKVECSTRENTQTLEPKIPSGVKEAAARTSTDDLTRTKSEISLVVARLRAAVAKTGLFIPFCFVRAWNANQISSDQVCMQTPASFRKDITTKSCKTNWFLGQKDEIIQLLLLQFY